MAAADARGLKRICTDCGSRFYDLNKRPVICPGCQTEFTGEVKTKTRRGRALAEDPMPKKEVKSKKESVAESENETANDDTLVSLDDVKDAEDAGTDDDDEGLALGDDDLGAGIEELDDGDDDLSADVDIPKDKDE